MRKFLSLVTVDYIRMSLFLITTPDDFGWLYLSDHLSSAGLTFSWESKLSMMSMILCLLIISL